MIPLEPDAGQLQELTRACMALVGGELACLAELPAADVRNAAQLVQAFREPAPDQGQPVQEVLARLVPAIRCSFNTAGPGYLAYIPGGGLPTSALASYIAAAVNRYVGVRGAAPALAEIEASVIRWLASIMGYPEAARGVLTSGGSIANFTAIATARTARLPEDFLRGTIYLSGQTHASVLKAARLAGFPTRAIRIVPVDARLRLEAPALAKMIRADRARGDLPFLVVANAGTTNTGAVDPLGEIVQIASTEGLWVHADGAYGGLFRLADETLMSGIGACDSITIDPHKALFLPYGIGAVLVRDGEALRRAHQIDAGYLRDLADETVSFTDLSPELSRPLRGLAAWLPIQLHGLGAFREALREKLQLARDAADRIERCPRLELVDRPQLSIVAFRLRDRDNRAQTELLDRVNARGRVFLSSTLIDEKVVLRICVLSFRTHADRMDDALTAIEQETERM